MSYNERATYLSEEFIMLKFKSLSLIAAALLLSACSHYGKKEVKVEPSHQGCGCHKHEEEHKDHKGHKHHDAKKHEEKKEHHHKHHKHEEAKK